MRPVCLITGSSGLVGSNSVKLFIDDGFDVIGVDNDMRKYFFGTSTDEVREGLEARFAGHFTHCSVDIRDYDSLENIFKNNFIVCIIHCAAQPSHDWAAKEPFTDFGVNALGTLNMLELTRKYCSSASFIFMSTNKVYGDTPNRLPVEELATRYEFPKDIDENMYIDQCKHSLFGASKAAADLLVQEYGRYFNMNTVCFRGGCITGSDHQGAQEHGFLAYLVKCVANNEPYKVFGYKGKQVRDNIHAYDLARAFMAFHKKPRSGAVYNIGGGRANSVSILEAVAMIDPAYNKLEFINEERSGDHIWYISDLTRFKADYPEWDITLSLGDIINDLISKKKN